MRLNWQQWAKLKPRVPFCQLPVLEFGGSFHSQSNAILRYIGKKTGLYPDSDIDALRVDETIDTIDDLVFRIIPTLKEQDMERKLAMRRALAVDILPRWLACVNKRFVNGYLLGERMSIADLCVFNVVEWLKMGVLDGIPSSIIDPHQNLKALRARVLALPQLQGHFEKYYKKDPKEIAKEFARAVEKFVLSEKSEYDRLHSCPLAGLHGGATPASGTESDSTATTTSSTPSNMNNDDDNDDDNDNDDDHEDEDNEEDNSNGRDTDNGSTGSKKTKHSTASRGGGEGHNNDDSTTTTPPAKKPKA